jgi:hypothetical protein
MGVPYLVKIEIQSEDCAVDDSNRSTTNYHDPNSMFKIEGKKMTKREFRFPGLELHDYKSRNSKPTGGKPVKGISFSRAGIARFTNQLEDQTSH